MHDYDRMKHDLCQLNFVTGAQGPPAEFKHKLNCSEEKNSTTLIKENLVFCPDPVQKMKSTGSGYGTNHQSKYRRTNYLTSGASAVHRVALYEVATGWI